MPLGLPLEYTLPSSVSNGQTTPGTPTALGTNATDARLLCKGEGNGR